MSIDETGTSRSPDPRWAVNRLEARGVGGLGRRISVRAAAMMQRHFRISAADQCGVLVYRRLAPKIPGTVKPTLSVTPERFRTQLAGLLARGRVFWPLEKIHEFRKRRWRVMPWVTAISFDIGFAGIHSYALPILRDLNIPATVFLDADHFSHVTMFPADDWAKRHHDRSPVEAFRPLSVEECREVVRSGLISVGSQSQSETHQASGATISDPKRSLADDRRVWQRICVASWDTPNTLAVRLSSGASSYQRAGKK